MDKVRNSLGVSVYLHGRSLCLRHNLSFTHIKRTALVVVLDPVLKQLCILLGSCIWKLLWGVNLAPCGAGTLETAI